MNYKTYIHLNYSDQNDFNKPFYEVYLDKNFLDKISSLDEVGHHLIRRAIEHEEKRMKILNQKK